MGNYSSNYHRGQWENDNEEASWKTQKLDNFIIFQLKRNSSDVYQTWLGV